MGNHHQHRSRASHKHPRPGPAPSFRKSRGALQAGKPPHAALSPQERAGCLQPSRQHRCWLLPWLHMHPPHVLEAEEGRKGKGGSSHHFLCRLQSLSGCQFPAQLKDGQTPTGSERKRTGRAGSMTRPSLPKPPISQHAESCCQELLSHRAGGGTTAPQGDRLDRRQQGSAPTQAGCSHTTRLKQAGATGGVSSGLVTSFRPVPRPPVPLQPKAPRTSEGKSRTQHPGAQRAPQSRCRCRFR